MMAATLMDWLTKFPALFALAGAFLGSIATCVVGWLVLRRYGPATGEARKELVELQKQQLETLKSTTKMQLDSQTSTLAMQKEHYETEHAETRRKYEADIVELKAKCQTAEDNLHTKRNEWNAEQLKLALENEQLKARPDVTSLFEFEKKSDERRESFYTTMGETMGKMAKVLDGVSLRLEEHDSGLDKRMQEFVQPVIDGMAQVVEAINGGLGGKTKRRMKNKRAVLNA